MTYCNTQTVALYRKNSLKLKALYLFLTLELPIAKQTFGDTSHPSLLVYGLYGYAQFAAAFIWFVCNKN